MLYFCDPGNREHMQKGGIVRQLEDGFVFRCEQYEPGEWVFRELNIEDFRTWMGPYIIGAESILQQVSTTEELQAWFQREFS